MARPGPRHAEFSAFAAFVAVWSGLPLALLMGKLFGPIEVDDPLMCVSFALPAATVLLLPLCMIVLPRARRLEWWLLALQQVAWLLPAISARQLLGGLGITPAGELAVMEIPLLTWWVLLPVSLVVASVRFAVTRRRLPHSDRSQEAPS